MCHNSFALANNKISKLKVSSMIICAYHVQIKSSSTASAFDECWSSFSSHTFHLFRKNVSSTDLVTTCPGLTPHSYLFHKRTCLDQTESNFCISPILQFDSQCLRCCVKTDHFVNESYCLHDSEFNLFFSSHPFNHEHSLLSLILLTEELNRLEEWCENPAKSTIGPGLS